ncbi:hypothetical protein JHK87_011620 [Glycine soja]|nr:hypothetical protein JHK87_011620 [Glycine soja]
MAAIIDCSSSSPFGYFQLNTNPKVRTSLSLSLSFISKLSVVLTLRYDEAFLANTVFLLRLSQFVNQQNAAHLTSKDKSYGHIFGVPKLRSRLQTPQTALVVGSEDHSHISGLQRATKDTFQIGNSSFHISGNDGKPAVSFCNRPFSRDNEVISSDSEWIRNTLSWFIGPVVLVASFCFPLICLPKMISNIFGSTVSKALLLSFSQEAIFYCGVAVFLLLLDHLMRPKQLDPSANKSDTLSLQLGKEYFYSIASMMIRQLGITIPMVTLGLTWPWNGHVIPVTLAPYMVGVFVQSAFEMLALYWKSPSWPAIPFIFHVYRLHQIHKATLSLTFLLYDLAEAEKVYSKLPLTPSTWLGLTTVLQILLVIWIWSFSSFLVKFIRSASSTKSDADA